ncbi:hypothetical protein [Planococcus lenghuensis]|uniref:Small CPxCG-related zinc finger protein n=1 Tax=Planococcus lenghuensis TaxID=2213202 RepID=A0A1Q2L4W1_9BACL|nr:hypothetical protein [Planococcus lenghuensis]AQQ55488.1 hypothetical protein B0X71_20275 [Planococcus lenghuensis]
MAEIYHLTICAMCRRKIRTNETYTRWESAFYCEPCFDDYLDLLEPADFISGSNSERNDC